MSDDPKKNNPQGNNRELSYAQSIQTGGPQNNVITTARALHDLGFVPMPVGIDKRPKLPSWKYLQAGNVEWPAIQRSFQQYPSAGIAILTGIKGFAVLDIDDTDLADIVLQYLHQKTLVIRTQSGGVHVYLREKTTSRSAPLVTGVADMKARGGYVVCPPTLGYRRESEAKKPMTVENAREWAAGFLGQFGYEAKENKAENADSGTIDVLVISEGARNSTLASIAGALRHRGLAPEAIAAALQGINQTSCNPPLPQNEVTSIAKSYGRYEAGVPANNFTSNRRNHTLEVKPIPTLNAEELLHHAQAGGSEMPYLPLLGRDGYIPQGWCTLIAGAPKVGKTELLVALLREWALNTDTTILYITEEPQQVWERRLLRHPEVPWHRVRLAFGIGANLQSVLNLIEQASETIVVIDTIRNVLNLEDENNNSEVARILNPLIERCRELIKTLILAHHVRKRGGKFGEGIAGGHAIFGAVDVAIEIGRTDGNNHQRHLKGWGRIIEVPELLYEMSEDGNFEAVGDPREVELVATKARIVDILDDTGDWLATAGIEDVMGEPKPSGEQVRLALKSLAEDGTIKRDPDISVGSAQGKKVMWASSGVAGKEDKAAKKKPKKKKASKRKKGGGRKRKKVIK